MREQLRTNRFIGGRGLHPVRDHRPLTDRYMKSYSTRSEASRRHDHRSSGASLDGAAAQSSRTCPSSASSAPCFWRWDRRLEKERHGRMI